MPKKFDQPPFRVNNPNNEWHVSGHRHLAPTAENSIFVWCIVEHNISMVGAAFLGVSETSAVLSVVTIAAIAAILTAYFLFRGRRGSVATEVPQHSKQATANLPVCFCFATYVLLNLLGKATAVVSRSRR